MNQLPPSPENNTRIISNFSNIRRDIRKSRCTTGHLGLVFVLDSQYTQSRKLFKARDVETACESNSLTDLFCFGALAYDYHILLDFFGSCCAF
jgi:hypothetical protein